MQEIKYIDRKTGNILIENTPGANYLKFLYYNPLGKLALPLVVKRKWLSAWYGRKMNQASSKSKIQPFIQEHSIDETEFADPVNSFTSFNAFFYRKLQANARPIGEGFVSPADGKILAFENVRDLRHFFVKGNPFTIQSFLTLSELADQFKNVSVIINRLAPPDYHRYHFPCEGVPSAPLNVTGKYYSVSPFAIRPDFARVFCENKRSIIKLSTTSRGDVLICPVGATMVGTIVHTYDPDVQVNKGDEMGYFAFGGSSLLTIVQKDAIEIDPDILENSKAGFETSIYMGERIGG